MEKYLVELTDDEYAELRKVCNKGQQSARKIRKANILLEAAAGRTDDEIVQNLNVGYATVQRTRRRFVEGNLKYALNDCARDGRPKVFDGIQEAALVALACTIPPEGHAVWTMELLTEQMVLLGVAETISRESVRLMLKKNDLKPWQKQEWCIPKIDAEYVWRMEDVLELYGDPFDESTPVICYAEIEFSVLHKQCLDNRYISNADMLEKEVAAWESRRNNQKAKVEWMFAVEDARKKMGHLYPKLLKTVANHLEQKLQAS